MFYDFGERSGAFKKGIQFEAEDDFKYTKANGYSFRLTNKGYVMFSGTKDGFNKKLLHRVLMEEPIGLEIDHADGNPLNNCLYNLRVCSHKQNSQNRTKHSNNTSGYKNVFWDKQQKKWTVQINGKFYGRFATLEEANEHAILKRAEMCGEFARD